MSDNQLLKAGERIIHGPAAHNAMHKAIEQIIKTVQSPQFQQSIQQSIVRIFR